MLGRTALPGDRGAAVSADARAARVLLVPAAGGERGVMIDEQPLIEYVTHQRWYGAKSRTVSHSRGARHRRRSAQAEPQLRARPRRDALRHRRARDLPAPLLGRRRGAVDGLAEDAGLARETRQRDAGGLTLQGAEGVAEFSPVDGFAGARPRARRRAARSAPSSRTASVVFDDELILKVFRRLEPGINPELEMLRFLTEHGLPQHRGARRLVRVLGRPARPRRSGSCRSSSPARSTAGSSRSTRSRRRPRASSTGCDASAR